MGLLLAAVLLEEQRAEWLEKHLIYKQREEMSARPPIQLEIAQPSFSPDTETGLLPSEPGAIPEVEVCLAEAPHLEAARVHGLSF